jgi:hypothetical protein
MDEVLLTLIIRRVIKVPESMIIENHLTRKDWGKMEEIMREVK